jgi:hypothetical protein
MRTLVLALLFALAGLGAGAQEVHDDLSTPLRNAVARLGGCTATLITPDILLTVAHCTPRNQGRTAGMRAQCKGLEYQNTLAKHPFADEIDWTEIARKPGTGPWVVFGASSADPILRVAIGAYAIPHCADMALIRLTRPVPPDVAVPIPAITHVSDNVEGWLATTRLVYAGFGSTDAFPRGRAWRQTGRVGYWTRNRCHIFTLPPERAVDGPRILHGDSGSPLLAETADGPRVIGVLFGWGTPDVARCGFPTLPVPRREGTYTLTFRGPVEGTDATDLGAWIDARIAAAH